MGYSVNVQDGMQACAASVESFVATGLRASELDLLGPSRCYGWSRLDVLTHVIDGWHELLAGLVSPVRDPATVDAASFWTAFAQQFAGRDPVVGIMSQRRRTAAYHEPSSVLEQLADLGAATARGVRSLTHQRLLWLGQVFESGDYLAVWAVEHAIHELDLDLGSQPPASAMTVARRTIESLAPQIPADWSDEHAVLVGAGRVPVPPDHPELADVLPVIV